MSELEPDLGLGRVVEVIGSRFVEVLFPGAGLKRRYAQAGAPLRRVVLSPGQSVRLSSGEVGAISAVRGAGSLVLYRIGDRDVPEADLGAVVEEANPVAEALAGRWDHPRAFDLRNRAWRLRHQSLDPDLRGLAGARISLLPHQLYVAQATARREFPRVLLADEVGLGKTIEAGLVFSYLRASDRANRVLVLTPESLKFQWLAEMYRRFNELFTVVDEDRALAEDAGEDSVFQESRRIICSRDFLLDYPDWLESALESTWDLLIVDEAHHLEWSEKDASPQWEMVRALSERSRGLLLLTATPERRGIETEFGLLRLVDPERFSSFPRFEKEMAGMKALADVAKSLQEGKRDPALLRHLEGRFAGDDGMKAAIEAFRKGAGADVVLRPLVDRHGTSRVFVRNRRSRIRGFPERRYRGHGLPAPAALAERLAGFVPGALEDEEILRIASGRWRSAKEPSAQQWFLGRAGWLLGLLRSLKGEKVLLICGSAKRAMDLQTWLRDEGAVRTALFHEGMEIVERDRQAAWFAEPQGAQVLVCSEIGSEGRNFQFAHHLVSFDLPLHPDMLEQRIGRLDRIGQRFPVEIHVPYFTDTPEEVLVRWFAEGLESFSRPWNGGFVEELAEELVEVCRAYLPKAKDHKTRKKKLEKLLGETREVVEAIRRQQSESTDVLIDINSFDETKGRALAERIRKIERSGELESFLEAAFDYFGVEVEKLDEAGTLKLSTHSLTFVDNFPGLTTHGERLVTFDREHALVREELDFVSWDHPVTQGALSLVIEGRAGRVSAALWESLPVPCLIEILYVVSVTAPAYLEVERDLGTESFTLYVTPEGKVVPAPKGMSPRPAPLAVVQPWMNRLREALPAAVNGATERARRMVADTARQAAERRRARLGEERQRLRELAKVNPLITEEELQEHEARLEAGLSALAQASPRLDALRLLFKS